MEQGFCPDQRTIFFNHLPGSRGWQIVDTLYMYIHVSFVGCQEALSKVSNDLGVLWELACR